MEFKDLINNCAKTSEEMKSYGFPKNVTDAFILTTDEVHSVVMSCVPGKAATGLIDEGYDLKGMYIKAKSCDWGPMAGFVCELPPFNKNGAAKIGAYAYHNENFVYTWALKEPVVSGQEPEEKFKKQNTDSWLLTPLSEMGFQVHLVRF